MLAGPSTALAASPVCSYGVGDSCTCNLRAKKRAEAEEGHALRQKQTFAARAARHTQRTYSRAPHAGEDINKEDWDAVKNWFSGVMEGLAALTLTPVGEGAAAAGALHGQDCMGILQAGTCIRLSKPSVMCPLL